MTTISPLSGTHSRRAFLQGSPGVLVAIVNATLGWLLEQAIISEEIT